MSKTSSQPSKQNGRYYLAVIGAGSAGCCVADKAAQRVFSRETPTLYE